MYYLAEFNSIKSNLQGNRDYIVKRRLEARWSLFLDGRLKMNVHTTINTEVWVVGIDAMICKNCGEIKSALSPPKKENYRAFFPEGGKG